MHKRANKNALWALQHFKVITERTSHFILTMYTSVIQDQRLAGRGWSTASVEDATIELESVFPVGICSEVREAM